MTTPSRRAAERIESELMNVCYIDLTGTEDIRQDVASIIDEELAPLREAAKALKDALGDASPDTDLCSGREHKEMWERYEAALTHAEEAGI